MRFQRVIAISTLGLLLSVAGGFGTFSSAVAAEDAKPILTESVPAIPGPKRSVAVGAFDTIGNLSSGSTGWNVGGSVAAMLTTALLESGRFIVVERAGLGQIVTEQELAAHHVSGGSAAPTPGKVIPAQYLIEGAVTEFGTADSGSGISIGGVSGPFSSGLALSGSKGSVAFDIRIVNTRTTAVEHSIKVRRELSSTGVGFTGGYKGISLGGNEFWNTPLGKTTRQALNEAVQRIAEALAEGEWQGAIVEVDGDTVFINAGSAAGIKIGDQLAVERSTKIFTDPTTGEVLGQRQALLGTVTISNVEDKLSSGRYATSDPAAPARGDVVVFKSASP